MKHLRKYNESKESEIIDYIKLVFSDFIDNGSELEHDEGISAVSNKPFAECSIDISLPTLEFDISVKSGSTIGDISGDINLFKKQTEETLKVFVDIETCINRIKDEYPDMRYRITKELDEIHEGKLLSYVMVYFEWGDHGFGSKYKFY